MAKSTKALPENVTNLSFEEALQALEAIVSKLESGEVALEESIEIYTRGTELKQHCQAKLKDATARIEKITISENGVASEVAPFDAD
jgi:exodeoxyribonuclease VII small subunit